MIGLTARPTPARIGQAAGQQQTQVLLAREGSDGSFVRIGGNDDLGEDLADRFGGRSVQRDIDRDDPAKGRNVIAAQRALPCIKQAGTLGDAAGVGVLDDHHGRVLPLEFGAEFQRGVGVVDHRLPTREAETAKAHRG